MQARTCEWTARTCEWTAQNKGWGGGRKAEANRSKQASNPRASTPPAPPAALRPSLVPRLRKSEVATDDGLQKKSRTYISYLRRSYVHTCANDARRDDLGGVAKLALSEDHIRAASRFAAGEALAARASAPIGNKWVTQSRSHPPTQLRGYFKNKIIGNTWVTQ